MLLLIGVTARLQASSECIICAKHLSTHSDCPKGSQFVLLV